MTPMAAKREKEKRRKAVGVVHFLFEEKNEKRCASLFALSLFFPNLDFDLLFLASRESFFYTQ